MPSRIQRRRTKGKPPAPGEQSFTAKIDKEGAIPTYRSDLGPCWLWKGAQHNAKGYGRFEIDGQRYLAHRFAYHLWGGELIAGMEIDHLCRNTRCVNPQHLEQVTPEEHAHRTDQGAYQRKRTHCPAGHEYTQENTRMRDSSRHCRACDSTGTGLKGTHNGQSKLTEGIVIEARARRAAGERVGDLAAYYGVAQSVMSRALAGVTWSHV
ncbi:HNH endonuclease signature motif containing protein [Streptomyces albidoflavus]